MKNTNRNFNIYLIASLVLLVLFIILGVGIGSTYIKPSEVIGCILHKFTGTSTLQPMNDTIIWEIRLPRVILAAITGAALAICGILMQSITRNPVSDPYILGISSGASVGAVAVIVIGGSFLGQFSVAGGAFIGATVCGVLVFAIGTQFGKVTSTSRLILSGLALSTIFSALSNLLIYSAENSNQAKSAMFWIMGSLGGAKWDSLLFPSIVLLVVLLMSIIISKSLDLMLFGESSSVVLGMNVKLIKSVVLVSSTFLISVIVSLTGSIGFIGLVVPHIVRVIIDGSNHKKLLILSPIIGAILLIAADVLSRAIFAPRELPIGIITSLIGGPFFIWLIWRRNYSFGGEK